MVEEVSDKPQEKIEQKIDKPPETIPTKEVVEEVKPLETKVDEVLVASSLAPYRPYTNLPTLADEKEPRVFMTIPRQKQMEEVQPRIEKPKVVPAKVEPKIEQVRVSENVGVSIVFAPKSYDLPASIWEEKPRVFLAVDTKPAATESIEEQEKAVADITKKTPDRLDERQLPEVKIEKPKPEPVIPQITPKKPPQLKKPIISREWTFLTMGAGYGPSGGSGFGGFIQLNTKKGFSFHAGAGLYPTTYFYSQHDWVKNQVLYSVGIKYFLPFKANWIRPYLDLQYGGISVEAVRLVTGIWHYQYTYENIQKTLYGPSILAGIELKLGNIGLNGAIGLSYNTTEWDYWERDYFLTADVGLLIYLF
jgi:hypothetical protein